MLDEGVRRMDAAYASALQLGVLRPDPSLIIEQPIDATAAIDNTSDALDPGNTTDPAAALTGATTTFTVQFETPDVASVTSSESMVRAVGGVTSVSTTSLALGGVSVMRVGFNGDAAALRAALIARGFRVEGSGDTLRIRRGGDAALPATPPTP